MLLLDLALRELSYNFLINYHLDNQFLNNFKKMKLEGESDLNKKYLKCF